MSGTPPAAPVFDPFAQRADDHAFVRSLAGQAPLARTSAGAYYAWRARHADVLTSPDTSRQIELETLAVQGIVDGPIHELFVNGMLFSNGAAHRTPARIAASASGWRAPKSRRRWRRSPGARRTPGSKGRRHGFAASMRCAPSTAWRSAWAKRSPARPASPSPSRRDPSA